MLLSLAIHVVRRLHFVKWNEFTQTTRERIIWFSWTYPPKADLGEFRHVSVRGLRNFSSWMSCCKAHNTTVPNHCMCKVLACSSPRVKTIHKSLGCSLIDCWKCIKKISAQYTPSLNSRSEKIKKILVIQIQFKLDLHSNNNKFQSTLINSYSNINFILLRFKNKGVK